MYYGNTYQPYNMDNQYTYIACILLLRTRYNWMLIYSVNQAPGMCILQRKKNFFSVYKKLLIFVLPAHVLPIHFLPIYVLLIHVLSIHVLLIHVLPVHVLSKYVLLSMFYFLFFFTDSCFSYPCLHTCPILSTRFQWTKPGVRQSLVEKWNRKYSRVHLSYRKFSHEMKPEV